MLSYRHKNYFGYDPRVFVLEKQWLDGKRCLDIGCNAGFFTLDLALTFDVTSVHGVDIDSSLISKAIGNKKRFILLFLPFSLYLLFQMY